MKHSELGVFNVLSLTIALKELNAEEMAMYIVVLVTYVIRRRHVQVGQWNGRQR
jgi:hypothetical protein